MKCIVVNNNNNVYRHHRHNVYDGNKYKYVHDTKQEKYNCNSQKGAI